MEYEWTTVCNLCGYVRSQGGFSTQQNLTNDQVFQNAGHNPGCVVPTVDPPTATITSQIEGNVTRYTISH